MYTDQVEGKRSPYIPSSPQTKPFLNRTTLKVTVASLIISSFVASIFTIGIGVSFFSAIFAVYTVVHLKNSQSPVEYDVVLYDNNKTSPQNEGKQRPRLADELELYDTTSSAPFLEHDDAGTYLREILAPFKKSDEFRSNIIHHFEEAQGKIQTRSTKLLQKKIDDIEIFLDDLNQVGYDKTWMSQHLKYFISQLYTPLLRAILYKKELNQEKAKTLIDLALSQNVKTTIVDKNIAELFLSGDYITATYPAKKGTVNKRIYNIYELFITYLLLPDNTEYIQPEDSAVHGFDEDLAHEGLKYLGIKNPKNAWQRIRNGKDSNPRTAERKLAFFFGLLNKANLKKAQTIKELIDVSLKIEKEIPESKDTQYQQPGLPRNSASSPLSPFQFGENISSYPGELGPTPGPSISNGESEREFDHVRSDGTSGFSSDECLSSSSSEDEPERVLTNKKRGEK